MIAANLYDPNRELNEAQKKHVSDIGEDKLMHLMKQFLGVESIGVRPANLVFSYVLSLICMVSVSNTHIHTSTIGTTTPLCGVGMERDRTRGLRDALCRFGVERSTKRLPRKTNK